MTRYAQTKFHYVVKRKENRIKNKNLVSTHSHPINTLTNLHSHYNALSKRRFKYFLPCLRIKLANITKCLDGPLPKLARSEHHTGESLYRRHQKKVSTIWRQYEDKSTYLKKSLKPYVGCKRLLSGYCWGTDEQKGTNQR